MVVEEAVAVRGGGRSKSNVPDVDFTASKDERNQKAQVSRGSSDLLLLLFPAWTVGHWANTAAEPRRPERRFKGEARQTDTERQ